MRSIHQEVAYLLNKHIAIQKDLKRGIINIRALAKFLIEEYSLKHSLDAVVSAIRRYDLEDVSLISSKGTGNIFSKLEIHTKDNVARIVLKETAFKEISQDFLGDKVLRGNSRMVRAKDTITLLVVQDNLKEKLDLFKKSEIIKIQKNLSEIRLRFAEDIGSAKGLMARIAAEIAMRGVSIEEFIVGIPDILIYVNEKSLIKAHQALREIKEYHLK